MLPEAQDQRKQTDCWKAVSGGPHNSMAFANNIPADVSSIEHELQQQWRIHASTRTVVRTRTLNLVIASPETQMPAELVEQVTQAHPCRVLVLERTREPSKLHAEISTSCASAQSGTSCLVREEVRLLAPAQLEGGKIESLVVPLLVSDVPVFLWWRGTPDFTSELFVRLAAHANRVILDSSEFKSAWSGLTEIARAISSQSWRARISDLAWGRMTIWRELTTQFFDNRRCGEHPQHIRLARIAYGGGDHLPADAVLLAAWVAHQLGWRAAQPTQVSAATRNTHFRLALQRDGDQREIEFVSDGAAPPGIASLQLVAEGERAGLFTIEHTPDYHSLVTTSRLAGQEQVQRTVRSRISTLPEMIVRELSLTGRDVLYEQVLIAMSEIGGAT
jgi:glucose-6-phosphate dehydrogenase assembly protein OpcA